MAEARLVGHLRGLLGDAIVHAPPTPALVLVDHASPLARRLAGGYRLALPHARVVDVDAAPLAEVWGAIDALPPGALVVLVQSTRFPLAEFRARLALFQRGLAVVEHPHLGRVPEAEAEVYVDALAYDPAYFRGTGRALKARLDVAAAVVVRTAAGALVWRGPFEPARLNVGDYAGMASVGGQFPIGEVFTEPVDLTGLDGAVSVSAYGAEDFSVAFVEPFALRVEAGRVRDAPGAPPAFARILATIAAVEREVWVRELGFGLNRALGPARRLSDVSAYERMCGVHLSLGARHAVFPKPGFPRRKGGFHVDVFVDAPEVWVDGRVVHRRGEWTVGVSEAGGGEAPVDRRADAGDPR